MEQENFLSQILSEFNTKLRDSEEKQRLLKERVLLIGQNLIEAREVIDKDIAELKINMKEMKEEVEKIKTGLIRLGEELEKRARKTDLEILSKQAKMFSPLELVRLQDLKRIIGKNDN